MKCTILSLVLASTVGLPAAAMAADNKTYPGSSCVRYSGASPSYSFSMIGNPSSSSWTYLDCPIINDENSDTASAWVGVLDRHYTSNVRCALNTAYWNNSADSIYGWWGPTRYSSGSSNDRQVLSWSSQGGTGFNVHTYFSCAIPPTYSGNRSYIISYYHFEG